MKLALVCAIAALGCVAVSAEGPRQYHGYQVLRTEPLSAAAVDLLRGLQKDDVSLDFWKEAHKGVAAEIMAGPERIDSLKSYLKEQAIDFSIKVDDVQELISSTATRPNPRVRTGPSPRYSLTWDDYYDFDVLNEFIDELAESNDWVDTVSIGSSYEGRDMRVIQLTKAGEGKPNVWIEAGIHAREWIAPAVATYIIKELVENYDAHPEYVDNLNIHIIPSANPDGYQYSRDSDRMWRKTRSDTDSTLNCKGVDPNRNFGYHFGESGVSDDKCSDIYPGPEAFSEIETQNIRDYVLGLEPTPVIAKAIHSAAELWLWPYGYAYDTYPDNYEEMRDLAQAATDALNAVHGQNFLCQNSAELYPAAGDSNDWYTGSLGARFTSTVELRDGGFGFLLPAEQIVPSGEEMWAAYQVILDQAIEWSK